MTEDARIRRTKEKLHTAFVELLQEQPVSEIASIETTAPVEVVDVPPVETQITDTIQQSAPVVQPVEPATPVIIGEDYTQQVIDDYMDGKYTKEEAVKRLLPQNLTDQYAFLTEKAIERLSFEGSETL